MNPPTRSIRHRLLAAACILGAGLLAAWLLGPKLLVVDHANILLTLDHDAVDTFWILQQDLLVATLLFAATLWAMSGRKRWPLLLVAVLSITVWVVLMLDTRVRQLYLKPVNLDLITYYIDNSSDLAAGADYFWKYGAGFGLTFRRLFVFGLAPLLAGWGLLIILWPRVAAPPTARRLWLRFGLLAMIAAVAFAAICAPRFPYLAHRNILVAPLLGPFREQPNESIDPELAASFEQPIVPIADVLAKPRIRLAKVKAFRNLALVILESVRWKGMRLESAQSPHLPNLQRLARQGLLARCSVSLPHSIKAYYTILTGRYPFPDLIIREGLSDHFEALPNALRQENKNMNTMVFSSLYLPFENTDGMLQACGFVTRLGTDDLLPHENRGEAKIAFGNSDAPLYEFGVPRIPTDRPFLAMFFPTAAHYPYTFPGKSKSDGDDLTSFHKSVRATDDFIAKLVANFRQRQLLKDTLFIFVGDHGESFGEHGSRIHNNSMYEEEIAVPLVFWSADGRMKHDQVLQARQIDIAPTVVDLFGSPQVTLHVQGQSLLRSRSRGSAFATSFFAGVAQAVLDEDYKYIYSPTSDQLLRFDLQLDPDEKQPVVVTDGAEKQRITRRLRAFDAHSRLNMPSASRR